MQIKALKVSSVISSKHLLNFICNRRMLVILCQGFASGLPLAIVGSTLQTWFAVSGISIVTIGALTLIGQPYAYKFLWAPLLDRYTLPFLGRRRGWMLTMQLSLVVAIYMFSFFNPIDHSILLATLALITAFISATHDIVIDAYRAELFSGEERGLSISIHTAGYRIAMLVSSGGALILADIFGWAATYQLIAGLMLLAAAVTTFIATEPTQHHSTPNTVRKAVIEPFKEFWQRPEIIMILVFIILYKLTDALALSLCSKFLIDLGFGLKQIGAVYKGVGLIATMAGSFCGGLLMIRISLFSALLRFGILQALSNLTFAWLALAGKNMTVFTIAIFSENFCSGLGTVAFVAMLMSLCNKRYTATQYALLSSLAVIGRTYVGPIAGVIAQNLQVTIHPVNWAIFYVIAGAAAIPSFIVLYYLHRKKIFTTLEI